jgi:hypothetical protein
MVTHTHEGVLTDIIADRDCEIARETSPCRRVHLRNAAQRESRGKFSSFRFVLPVNPRVIMSLG